MLFARQSSHSAVSASVRFCLVSHSFEANIPFRVEELEAPNWQAYRRPTPQELPDALVKPSLPVLFRQIALSCLPLDSTSDTMNPGREPISSSATQGEGDIQIHDIPTGCIALVWARTVPACQAALHVLEKALTRNCSFHHRYVPESYPPLPS
jgi:hypothetical protein